MLFAFHSSRLFQQRIHTNLSMLVSILPILMLFSTVGQSFLMVDFLTKSQMLFSIDCNLIFMYKINLTFSLDIFSQSKSVEHVNSVHVPISIL